MKKCPKCGADNRPDSSVCFNCFTRIDNVTPGVQPVAPGVPEPPQQPNRPQPLNPSAIPPQSPAQPVGHVQQNYGSAPIPPSPPYPQSGTYGQPPYPRRAEYPAIQADKKSSVGVYIGIFAFLIILIAGGIFAYWNYTVQPETSVGAVRTFIKAIEKKDRQSAVKCLSKTSMQLPDFDQKMDKIMDLLSDDKKIAEGAHYVLRAGPTTETTAIVYMKLPPAAMKKLDRLNDPNIPSHLKDKAAAVKKVMDAGMPLYLVKADKKWKIDLGLSVMAMEKMERDLLQALGMDPNMFNPNAQPAVPGSQVPNQPNQPYIPPQPVLPSPAVPAPPSGG